MARTKMVVDSKMVETALRNTEASGQETTWKGLFIAGAIAYNAMAQANPNHKDISPNVFKKRIEDLNLTIAMPQGKRGRQTGSTGGGRKSNWQLRAEAKCLSCSKGSAKKAASCGNAKCALHKDWAGLEKVEAAPAPAVDATPAPETAPVVTEAPVVAEVAETATA